MIRIDGMFREVNVRSVYAQKAPYKRLTEVMEHDQTFFDYADTEGTLVGIYCPPYMSYLNAVGWHTHFISKDRTKGGHVLGLNIADAVLTWDNIDGFQIQLPQNEMFSGFDLAVDQSEDLEKIELEMKKIIKENFSEKEPFQQMVFDPEKLEYLSSTGLCVFLMMAKHLGGDHLFVDSAITLVREIFDTTGFSSVVVVR